MPRSPDTSPQTLRVFEALLGQPDLWRYGYDLSKQTGLPSGTLYPILIRLSGRGFLETRWEEPEVPGRPPRHLYRLTADGVRVAHSRLAAPETSPPPAPPPRPGLWAWLVGRPPRGGRVGRAAERVLPAAVRGRARRGGPWGEALLAEL